MIEIRLLNKDFVEVKTFSTPYINLQWNSKYYEPGDFSIQLLPEHYSSDAYYVYTPDRRELGIILQVQYSQTATLKYVQLIGKFAECLLNDKVTYPQYIANKPVDEAIIEMVETYKDDLNIITEGVFALNPNEIWSSKGEHVGEKANAVLQPYGKSYQINYNYLTNILTFSIVEGIVRTDSNIGVDYVTFSGGFKNLDAFEADLDASTHKNYFIVEGQENIVETLDLSNGSIRKQLYIDETANSWDKEAFTEQQYREALKQIATENAVEYGLIKNIRIDTSDKPFTYLKDYFVGDIVTVIVEELQLMLEARIIAASEVFKSGLHEIEVEIGEPKATVFKRERLKR